MKQVLIDYDIIRYSAGFAADEEPLANCLHTVKLMIENIVAKTGAETYKGYLTGKGNFREQLAVTAPYKGNRPPRKPVWYKEIGEYLINHHNAVVIDGIEADDALGLGLTLEPDTVVASLDKDLLQVPGYHYNWKKDTLVLVEPIEGVRAFWKQVLMGDATDNIKGIPGVGPKTADKILPKMFTAPRSEDMWFETDMFYDDCYEVVYNAYVAHYGEEITGNFEEDCINVALLKFVETAQLVWILRHNTAGDIVEWEPKEHHLAKLIQNGQWQDLRSLSGAHLGLHGTDGLPSTKPLIVPDVQ